jgi:hypothetical protein
MLTVDNADARLADHTYISNPGDTAEVVVDGVSTAIDLSFYSYELGCCSDSGQLRHMTPYEC